MICRKKISVRTYISDIKCRIFVRYLIESPRWLASRGQFGKSVKLLQHIAAINKKKVNLKEDTLRKILGGQNERLYGVASLFSSQNLTRNTLLLVVCWYK